MSIGDFIVHTHKNDATIWLLAWTFYRQIKKYDTKGINRSRKLKKGRKYNGQKKKVKRSNNDIHITTQKNIDRATRIQIKTGEGGGMQLKNVHHSQLCNKQKYYILHQLWFSRNYLYNKWIGFNYVSFN